MSTYLPVRTFSVFKNDPVAVHIRWRIRFCSPRISILITLCQVRTGGRAVMRRLAEKLGYAHVTVNLMELIALEQDRPHQRQLLKQLISQHSANAQFIVWYLVIVHITYFMLSCKVIRQLQWKLACPSGTCGFGPSPIRDLLRDQNPNYLQPKYKKLSKKV